ncbi:hypothetical protein ACFX2F_037937 [Malus domestica]
MILLTFHSFDLKLVWNSERGILELLGFPVCILFCLFLRHGRCGSLRKHKMFKNEYSKARLGKQSGRGSRQSVPDRKIDTKCWLIALFLLVPHVKNNDNEKDKEKA